MVDSGCGNDRSAKVAVNKLTQKTVPVLDFIKHLIRQIPEKHFKVIRYGGLYARHRSITSKFHRVILNEKHPVYRNFTQWRDTILLYFGYNPLDIRTVDIKCSFLNSITTTSTNVRENYV